MLHKVSHPRSKTGSETKFLRYHPALVALHWISALVLLHTLGALYHHRFRKDQLWRRMWFEQRSTINPVRRRTNDTEV
jgi:cytochrome b561